MVRCEETCKQTLTIMAYYIIESIQGIYTRTWIEVGFMLNRIYKVPYIYWHGSGFYVVESIYGTNTGI
jgi:hypothetical protein